MGWDGMMAFFGDVVDAQIFLDVNNGEMDSQYVIFMEGLVWRRRKGRFCKIFFSFLRRWENGK